MNSIVVFSQAKYAGKEQLAGQELNATEELTAAQAVATALGGTFRQQGSTLVIDGLDTIQLTTITTVCRSHKLTWMENRSFLTGKALH